MEADLEDGSDEEESSHWARFRQMKEFDPIRWRHQTECGGSQEEKEHLAWGTAASQVSEGG